jgi:hypothetical protein
MNTELLRVGDAERDEVTTALHEHFVRGRLTREELDERLEATLSARTVGDLRKVTRDLPDPGVAIARPGGGRPWPPGPWGSGAGHGPWRPGSARWVRGPATAAWPRAGWGPPRAMSFGPLLVAAVLIAAFTGAWAVFPLMACVWFAAAFTGFRHARRRRLPAADRRV